MSSERKEWLRGVIPAVCLLVIFCLFFLFGSIRQERTRNEEKLPDTAGHPAELWEKIPEKAGKETAKESGGRKALIPECPLDLTALEKENSDLVGALCVPAAGISTPVVQGEDNRKYLVTAFSGEKDPAGAVFLDAGADPDLSDANTFVFAHSMRSGARFGSLARFYREKGLVQENPWIYFYTQEAAYAFRIFAYAPVKTDDQSVYSYIESREDYERFTEHMQECSWYRKSADEESAVALSSFSRLITLSTCYGTGHQYNFAVCAVMTAQEKKQPE